MKILNLQGSYKGCDLMKTYRTIDLLKKAYDGEIFLILNLTL